MKLHLLLTFLLVISISIFAVIAYNRNEVLLCDYVECPQVVSIESFVNTDVPVVIDIQTNKPIRVLPEPQYDLFCYDNSYEWDSDYDSYERTEVLEYEPSPTPTPAAVAEQNPITDNYVAIGSFRQNIYDVNNLDSYGRQKIVDNKNSAAYFTYDYHTYIVADHVNQGFSIIKTLSSGSTVSLCVDGVTQTYSVTGIDFNGTNNGLLFYADGSSVVFGNSADLVLYTCNENTMPRTITIVSCMKL